MDAVTCCWRLGCRTAPFRVLVRRLAEARIARRESRAESTARVPAGTPQKAVEAESIGGWSWIYVGVAWPAKNSGYLSLIFEVAEQASWGYVAPPPVSCRAQAAASRVICAHPGPMRGGAEAMERGAAHPSGPPRRRRRMWRAAPLVPLLSCHAQKAMPLCMPSV